MSGDADGLAPKHIETLLAHGGGAIDAASGGVVPPIQPATTFARGDDYQPLAPGRIYGRDDMPLYAQLEGVLAELEGVRGALTFPSGMAAIAAVMRAVPNGGAIVAQSGIYWGTTVWLRKHCARSGVRLVEVDATDANILEHAIAEARPGLVLVETPSNPWLGIVDLKRAATAAHAVGALLAVDSTAATPIHSRPASFGADIVLHSATKSLNGHSDVLAGVVASDAIDAEWWTAIRAERREAGAVLGPFETWLFLRGLRTLALRVERASANAVAIASFLNSHEAVERVLYPGLADHPGHDIAVQQMTNGFGSLMSFCIKGGARDALAVAGALKVIVRATSLGGVESLIEHRHTIEAGVTDMPENLLRLSVGIEHVDDLIGDLEQALSQIA
ncbi:MAG: cystathionine gamma-synthase [Hyphomicrobiales bacterium]|nr:MAG: cystathionine gamma-synthase [Hyphomicrobiales bacterium]